MTKLFSSIKAKKITLLFLFFVASISTAYGWFLFVPVITNYGRMLATYFPTFFTFGVPLFSFFMLWMCWHTYNVANRHRILKIYSITLVVLMGLCIPFHILSIGLSFGWNGIYGVLTPLFPYDVLVKMVLYLTIGIFILTYVIRNGDLALVPLTVKNPLRRRAFVAMGFVSAFTSYFFGAFFEVFFIFDTFDSNWYGMVPAILLFLLPLVSFILFVFYRHQKDEITKQKVYFYSLVSMMLSTLVLLLWVLIAVLINPYLFPQSLSNFYMLGYAAKMPIGFFLIIIMLFVEYLISFLRYRKRYLMKKDEK